MKKIILFSLMALMFNSSYAGHDDITSYNAKQMELQRDSQIEQEWPLYHETRSGQDVGCIKKIKYFARHIKHNVANLIPYLGIGGVSAAAGLIALADQPPLTCISSLLLSIGGILAFAPNHSLSDEEHANNPNILNKTHVKLHKIWQSIKNLKNIHTVELLIMMIAASTCAAVFNCIMAESDMPINYLCCSVWITMFCYDILPIAWMRYAVKGTKSITDLFPNSVDNVRHVNITNTVCLFSSCIVVSILSAFGTTTSVNEASNFNKVTLLIINTVANFLALLVFNFDPLFAILQTYGSDISERNIKLMILASGYLFICTIMSILNGMLCINSNLTASQITAAVSMSTLFSSVAVCYMSLCCPHGVKGDKTMNARNMLY